LDDNKAAVVFYAFYLASGPAMGALNFLLFNLSFSAAIVMVFSCLLFLILHFAPVFKKTRDQVRVQSNLLTMVLTQAIYLFYQLHPDYSYSDSTNMQLMLTIAIPMLLCLNFLVNASFFIYLLIKKVGRSIRDMLA
jgi:CDP-diglyceride synthetase